MSDEQKLEWLKTYERQNPAKYLRKYGIVTGKFPNGHPEAGQPSSWDYVSPEEAIKKISPSRIAPNLLKVDIVEKEHVVAELPEIVAPVEQTLEGAPMSEYKPKRGRKKNV